MACEWRKCNSTRKGIKSLPNISMFWVTWKQVQFSDCGERTLRGKYFWIKSRKQNFIFTQWYTCYLRSSGVLHNVNWLTPVEMWWDPVTHGLGVWRGNWQIQWVASTLHTTSEYGVSSITTADAAHLGLRAVDWTDAPHRADLNGLGPFRAKDEIWFLRMCCHI